MSKALSRVLAVAALGGITWAASARPAQAQSFDCRKATTPVEKAICSSPTLSALDTQLGALYKKATQNVPAKWLDQGEWLSQQRDKYGTDVDSLKAAYESRLEQLSAFAANVFFAREKDAALIQFKLVESAQYEISLAPVAVEGILSYPCLPEAVVPAAALIATKPFTDGSTITIKFFTQDRFQLTARGQGCGRYQTSPDGIYNRVSAARLK